MDLIKEVYAMLTFDDKVKDLREDQLVAFMPWHVDPKTQEPKLLKEK